MKKIPILLLFFISGFTALIYEVVWTRLFSLVFGNTTLAVSVVLSAYMTGMALGGLVIGRIADRIRHPLKFFALLELCIGLAAAFVFLVHRNLDVAYGALFFRMKFLPLFHILRFLTVFIVLFPATFCMGATLPVLSRVYIRRKQRIGRGFGALYGSNTLGAMLGSFSAGFILIYSVGVAWTVFSAVLVNIVVAVFAYAIALKKPDRTPEPAVQNDSQSPFREKENSAVFWIMAVSGFTAMAYEVLWNRILVFVLTNSVYAFSIMLTTFLGGLALGSVLGGKLADRFGKSLRLLAVIQLAIGTTALLTAVLLIHVSRIHDKLFAATPQTGWWQWNGIRFLETLVTMFPTTIIIGTAFPVAVRLIVPGMKKVGSGVGRLYFFNTAGCMLGSLITGFLLIGFLGTFPTIILMVMLNLMAGLYLIEKKRPIRIPALRMAAGFLAVVLITVSPLWVPKSLITRAYAHVEKSFPLIDYKEGLEGTVTVHENISYGERNKRIDVDGLNVAGTSFMLQTLQILQGHVPGFLHPDARDVLQIGFGTGQTSRSALLHPLSSYHLVEISPDVMTLSKIHFSDLNQGVLEDPRFGYSILDGRNFVKYTGRNYDIIMNDANYAVATASASLFTREHFEMCRSRLKPGGIFSTWMTIDLDPGDFATVLKTFQSVFPHAMLWMAPNCINKQVVLTGSAEPWQIDLRQMESRFNDPGIREDLSRINILSVYDWLDCIILDSEGIQSIARKAPVNSDNHPVLEFSRQSIRSRDFCSYLNLGRILIYRPDIRKHLIFSTYSVNDRRSIEKNLENHYRASGLFLQGMLAYYAGRTSEALRTFIRGSRMIPESRLVRHYFEKTDRITQQLQADAVRSRDPRIHLHLARHFIGLERYREAFRILTPFHPEYDNQGLFSYEIARCYLGLSEPDSAEMMIRRSISMNADWAAGWYFLGNLLKQKGITREALQAYGKALELDSNMYEAHTGIGNIHKLRGEFGPASHAYQSSLALMEFQPMVTADLADCMVQMKKLDQAIVLYHKSLAMAPYHGILLFKTGNAHYMAGKFSEASYFLEKASNMDPGNPEIFYNLGNVYVMQKRLEDAAIAFRRAVSIKPGEPDYYNNLALTYRELGSVEKALEVFEEGIQNIPNSPLLRRNYVELKQRTGKN
jgi:spermidine synthase